MSRSFKKKNILKDKQKGMKAIANRKVRNTDDIPNGMSYKKVFESYDISDWSMSFNEKEYIERCFRNLNLWYDNVEIIYLGKKNKKWIFKVDGKLRTDYSYKEWYKDFKGK